MQTGLLPLFPLQAVLLPGAPLPLHIFEDRYKEMIGEVLRAQTEFGVVLSQEKGIANSGCTATVEKVLHRYPEGRLDILTRGRRRFEIVVLNNEKAYLRGTVMFFDDEGAEAAPPELAAQAMEYIGQLRRLEGEAAELEANVNDPRLSFVLAQSVPDLMFRQVLLALRSEAERIRHLAEFLPRYIARRRRIAHIRDLAPRNGHGKERAEPG